MMIIATISNEINLGLLSLSGLVILLGTFSNWMRSRLWLSEPVIALLVGVILSPAVLGWIRLSDFGNPNIILEQGARFTLAIQLIGVALRLPKGYPFKQWHSLSWLLGLVLPGMWLLSGLLIYWILGLPFWVGMLIGAIIAPTDPVLATSIVTGKLAKRHTPERVRYTILAESGANDGLAYPFVLLPMLLLTRSPQEAVIHWLTRTILWEVGGAIVLGAILGYAAGWLIQWAEAKRTTDNRSFFSFTVALAVFVLGGLKLLGSDGILGVFVAGIALNQVVGGHERIEAEYDVQQAVELLFTLYIFLVLGLVIPWQQWLALGWKGLLLVIAILALRRLPILFLLSRWIKPLQSWQDVVFVGWFGPIGVAALFYSILTLQRTGIEAIWVVGSLVICASVLAFGTTDTPLTKRYGRFSREI